MICEEAKAFLQDYAEGSLSEGARATVDRHLADCPVCSQERTALAQVDAQLKAQPVLPAPPGIVERAMSRIFPARKYSFAREVLRLAAAAVILVAVTLGLLSLDLRRILGEGPTRFVEHTLRAPLDVSTEKIDRIYRGLSEENP